MAAAAATVAMEEDPGSSATPGAGLQQPEAVGRDGRPAASLASEHLEPPAIEQAEAAPVAGMDTDMASEPAPAAANPHQQGMVSGPAEPNAGVASELPSGAALHQGAASEHVRQDPALGPEPPPTAAAAAAAAEGPPRGPDAEAQGAAPSAETARRPQRSVFDLADIKAALDNIQVLLPLYRAQ